MSKNTMFILAIPLFFAFSANSVSANCVEFSSETGTMGTTIEFDNRCGKIVYATICVTYPGGRQIKKVKIAGSGYDARFNSVDVLHDTSGGGKIGVTYDANQFPNPVCK